MKWSDSITLTQTLRDVRLLTKAPSQDWEAHLREREEAAYENGRRDGERALSEQLLQQRNEMVELQNGVVNSLQRTLPQMIQETETTLINLALESAQKIVAGLPIDSADGRSRRARSVETSRGHGGNCRFNFIPTISRCCANTNRRC